MGLIEASGDYMGLAGNAFEVGPGGTTYPEGAGSPGQPAGGVPSAEKYAPDAASRLLAVKLASSGAALNVWEAAAAKLRERDSSLVHRVARCFDADGWGACLEPDALAIAAMTAETVILGGEGLDEASAKALAPVLLGAGAARRGEGQHVAMLLEVGALKLEAERRWGLARLSQLKLGEEEEEDADMAEALTVEDALELRVAELKEELEQRGQSTDGLKASLQVRLTAALGDAARGRVAASVLLFDELAASLALQNARF